MYRFSVRDNSRSKRQVARWDPLAVPSYMDARDPAFRNEYRGNQRCTKYRGLKARPDRSAILRMDGLVPALHFSAHDSWRYTSPLARPCLPRTALRRRTGDRLRALRP